MSKQTYTVKATYGRRRDIVIVQNPTLAPAIEKSDHEPKTPEVDCKHGRRYSKWLATTFHRHSLSSTQHTEKELAYLKWEWIKLHQAIFILN